MNNLLSYCGLVDTKIRASEKDLPVTVKVFINIDKPHENISLSGRIAENRHEKL